MFSTKEHHGSRQTKRNKADINNWWRTNKNNPRYSAFHTTTDEHNQIEKLQAVYAINTYEISVNKGLLEMITARKLVKLAEDTFQEILVMI